MIGSIGELETRGVRQIFEVKSNAKILFQYSHGEPAIVQVPVGTVKSRVYYALRALRLAFEEGRSQPG